MLLIKTIVISVLIIALLLVWEVDIGRLSYSRFMGGGFLLSCLMLVAEYWSA